jgi:hypothetical protein
MTEETLACAIQRQLETGSTDTKKAAVDALCIYLYTQLSQFRLETLDEDARSDFITWLYPRFGNIIDQFDPDRASFKTYLTWVVRLSWRSFLKKKYSDKAREKVYEIEEMTQLLSKENEAGDSHYAADTEPAYTKDRKTVALSKKKKEIHSRKVLLLACKSGSYIDDGTIKQVARATGYSEQFIMEKIEIIRAKCRKKRDMEMRDAEKKHGYYMRAQRCLYEMKYLERDSARFIQLRKEYEFCVKRIEALKVAESRHIRTPSNRFLAETLGICRGTIDTTLAPMHDDQYSEPS